MTDSKPRINNAVIRFIQKMGSCQAEHAGFWYDCLIGYKVSWMHGGIPYSVKLHNSIGESILYGEVSDADLLAIANAITKDSRERTKAEVAE